LIDRLSGFLKLAAIEMDSDIATNGAGQSIESILLLQILRTLKNISYRIDGILNEIEKQR
jgi:hypothetical protein